MSKKSFDILNTLTKSEILAGIDRIGNKKLTNTGHGFEVFGEMLIREAAEKSTLNYTDISKEKPAIGLISVVLSANRNYNLVVQPNIEKIQVAEPELKSFVQLENLLKTNSQEEFYTFWGHKDAKKYGTLKNILSTINTIKGTDPNATDDFNLMNNWAANADIVDYKNDPIGKLSNIAVATFQHLRMTYGVDTVKPDQRVKEVLYYEFKLPYLSDINVIKAVEQIASISEIKVITIDQIFVKYGSSYYNQKANKLSLKQLVKNLKKCGVANEIISKATLLSQGQVDQILQHI